jgi:hypothetical protein
MSVLAALWPLWLGIAAAIVLLFAACTAAFVLLIHQARHAPPVGDDTLAMLCPPCDLRQLWLPCDCDGDCGRRYCKWATILPDGQFTAELLELLDREGGGHE